MMETFFPQFKNRHVFWLEIKEQLWWKLMVSFSGCGGIFQANSGEIHSPNYPEPYSNNTDCSWLIQVDYSHRVLLNFTDFDIEDHRLCNYDNVTVSNIRNFKSFLNESEEILAKEEAYCAI